MSVECTKCGVKGVFDTSGQHPAGTIWEPLSQGGGIHVPDRECCLKNQLAQIKNEYIDCLAERDAYQSQNTQLRRELAQRDKRIEELENVLRDVEWYFDCRQQATLCPKCRQQKECGHTEQCTIQAALATDTGDGKN